MKKFYTTGYKLYTDKINEKIRVSIISDIHFSSTFKDKKINLIIDHMKKINPNYILIPGDIVDNLNELDNERTKLKFYEFLSDLGKISKVIMSYGNHDLYKKENSKLNFFFDKEFYNEINKIENVTLLNNDYYEDKDLYVYGITLSGKYYGHPHKEYLEVLKKELLNIKKCNENNKIKILLMHSPMHVDKVFDYFSQYDYVVCGHMHYGCVPPILNEIWKSDRGIISPTKKLFNCNSRNVLISKKDKIIVNGAVTTFSKGSGILQIFNVFYPIHDTYIDFTNDEKYDLENVLTLRKYN